MFWHHLWIDNGRPRHGLIADIRRRTRAGYKRAVKLVKRNQSDIKIDKMAQSLQSDDKRDFWDEVKRITASRNNMPCVVDDTHGDVNISKLFADKYQDLYNSVSYNVNDMDNVCAILEDNISNICDKGLCTSSHNITVDDVRDAILRLKPFKADGVEDASSDILIHGCNILSIHLSFLFNAMVKHGISPRNMLMSTLVPIPKNKKKSLNDSSNYRAIALGSVTCKVIDNIILDKHKYVLTSDNLQYGFKAKHSTTQCTFVLEEVIDYYVRNGSSVFMVLLDASKAFDRVQYVKLFKLLIKRGLCSLTARFLAYLYTNQSLRVNWNGCHSNPFVTSNGVKQGGILSPILFCIYIDELLTRLKASNVGCHIGNTFYGGLGYADDLCLLSPNRRSMCILLDICESFSEEYDVKFNSQKSHLILYDKQGKYQNMEPLYLNGIILNVQLTAKHLGHNIGSIECDSVSINQGIQELTWRTNYVMAKFGCCPANIRSFMFRTYCTNYYGCPLWRLDTNNITRFYASWRNSLRKIWGISRRTHCSLLKHLYGSPGIEFDLLSRFLSFYRSICLSNNQCTYMCALLCRSSNTAVAKNRRLLMSKLNSDGHDLISCTKISLASQYTCDIRCSTMGETVKELCLIRDGVLSSNLDTDEVSFILTDICIN